MFALFNKLCTVQVQKGPKNLSTFQGLQCMAVNGNAIRTEAKRPLKRDVHISKVQNS